MSDKTPELVGGQIDPFTVKRVCKPAIDPERLIITSDVERKESVHSYAMVEFTDLELPAARMSNIEQGLPDYEFAWDLFARIEFREDWLPDGYGLGDLVEAMSLHPNEEITLEVKTWETSKSQQDSETLLDDKNSSDVKTTQSAANELMKEHSDKSRTYVDASAGYSGFGISANVKSGYSNDVADLQKSVTKDSESRSARTASEMRATRKTRLAISRESGAESKSTRKIRNINQTQTLNVNFFSLLKKYKVFLYRVGADMLLLGPKVNLGGSSGGFHDPAKGPGALLNLGQLIEIVSRPGMATALSKQNGRNPNAVLLEVWSKQLDYLADALLIVESTARRRFIKSIPRHVRPVDGWVAPDNAGVPRWGYKIATGRETEFLTFLLGSTRVRVSAEPMPGNVGDAVMANPFDSNAAIVAPPIIREFLEPRRAIDTIVEPLRELQTSAPLREWTETLPAPGLHADLSLGVCSGAEDYFEAQRHFDLEMKRLSVAKLALEVERLKILNKRIEEGEATVRVDAENAETSVSVSVNADDAGSSIKIGRE